MTRTLRRQLPAADAVLLGVGGMLGAGVFAVFTPASSVAGTYALVGVVLASLLAACSAFSTADQARAFPGDGAGYMYTTRLLGAWPGRMAGSASVAGRFAAAAAIAGTFGAYVTPARPLLGALGVLAVAAALDVVGFRLNPKLNRVVVAVVVAVLAIVVAACFAVPPPVITNAPDADQPLGLLTSTGILVFAYLGFERITAPGHGGATFTARRLHLAIPVALVGVLGVYLAVGTAVFRQLGPTRLSLSPTPLLDAVISAGGQPIVPLIAAGAAVAAVAGLLTVLGDARRTVVAIAKDKNLPAVFGVDRVAGWAGGAVIAVLVLTLDVSTAITFAACAMLAYYAFTNASARILLREDRTWPMRTACFGLGLSVLYGMTMPPLLLGATVAVVLLGSVGMSLYRRMM
ncbi:APC family permease [Kutzneria buriramensis]|uniref:APA family basic amino acid/polyamine antiporter n=1 Tax=Kutzneria buriramensis TaxID=1045776 RepID=A0A3E0GUE6_9PSEU|nr:APC family permease [Kutzneria buriramensis]REH27051.1 APA family basic amino acid/polyamine antiporter [Kutzneria buriramensis]